MPISFNGTIHVITLPAGGTDLDVRDLWSRAVDWAEASGRPFLFPFDQVGGNETGPATSIPIYLFMRAPWKIQPDLADHTLTVAGGVLGTDDLSDPFLDATGFTVRINYASPVQAITVATGGGSAPTAAEVATAVWALVIEGSIDAKEAMRILLAVLAGKTTRSSITGGVQIAFRDQADTKDRALVDLVSSERTVVVLDPT